MISKTIIVLALLQFSKATVLEIISRSEWIARPPSETLQHLHAPIQKVVIAHTESSDCDTLAVCITKARAIQNYHMDARGFTDIGYNFLVGGDGLVYEGRGWDNVGQHTRGHNENTLSIAFIGTFDNKVPEFLPLRSAMLLLQLGVREGKLSPNYKLFGHRQLTSTSSPGNALYNEIKEWSHWSATML